MTEKEMREIINNLLVTELSKIIDKSTTIEDLQKTIIETKAVELIIEQIYIVNSKDIIDQVSEDNFIEYLKPFLNHLVLSLKVSHINDKIKEAKEALDNLINKTNKN